MATKTPTPTRHLALLRGINVGGNKKVPMANLRTLAETLGFTDVSTYIASGNLLFTSPLSPAAAEAELERAIETTFGFSVPVLVRTAVQWAAIARANPFTDAATSRPKFLHVGVTKLPPRADVATTTAKYCTAGERVAIAGGVVWLDYVAGAGSSKLTPTVLDRCAGSPLTARNWHTLQTLAELLSR